MNIHHILILSLVGLFGLLHEVSSACEWTGWRGQPGQSNGGTPDCRDEDDAYGPYRTYQATCQGYVDLDIKPCNRVYYYGSLREKSYTYALDIDVQNKANRSLFVQNLNSYYRLQVYRLGVRKGHLTAVPKEIFDLNNLVVLDLYDNDIQDIQLTSFVRISSLEELDLTFNKISDLNPVPVDGKSNVHTLRIGYNRIKDFPVDLLNYFPKLANLYLQNNQIETISMTNFDGAVALKHLDLTKNKLTSLSGDGFRRLSPNLDYLSVSLNSITKIPTKGDISFPELTMLSAMANEIDTFDSCDSFPNIQALLLSQNKITKITKNIFKTNEHLKIVDLDSNPIREIESDSFKNNKILFRIKMENTSVETIELLTFNGFNKDDQQREDIEIDLKGGKLINIKDDAFRGVKGLVKLYLNSNALVNISPWALNSLDSLKKLDISHNQLKMLDFKTSNMKKLEEFYAHHNKIEKISKSVFENLIALKTLDLSFNNIKEIDPKALANLKELNYINFSNNEEFDVMATTPLSELRNLEEFQLSETGSPVYENGSITYCKDSSDSTLNASFSKIKTIEYNAFGDCACLKHIILSHNELDTFHVNIDSIKNVKELLLDNNHIRQINSDTFNNLNRLRDLRLQNNDIVNVDANAFNNVPSLEYLYISSAVTPRTTFKVNSLPQSLRILSVENFDFDMNFNADAKYNMFRIKLISCGIKDLTRFNFSNFVKFQELYLHDNDISVVNQDTLKDLSALLLLDLSKNKLSSIAAGSFSNIHRLWYLDLSDNKISSLPSGVFDGPEKFISLNMSSNLLNTFDFKSLPPTSDIYLDNNPITTLNFNDAFSANITKLSVGHSVSCDKLINLEKSSAEKFKEVVTAEPLNSDLQNVNGIPC